MWTQQTDQTEWRLKIRYLQETEVRLNTDAYDKREQTNSLDQ